MWHPHVLEASRMMEALVGFFIALVVGITGIGGGSFTTPALILLAGLPAADAVGTAMIFAAVLRVLAAPFYLARRHVHAKYLGLLLIGAIPGLLLGTWLLHFLYVESWKSAVLILLGALLTFSSGMTFLPKLRKPHFASRHNRWLSWLAVPIGVETGFSSAGAGALGTILLLNFSELPVGQVVGTDLVFGIVLAMVGGTFHFMWGSIDGSSLSHLLMGGIPGVLVGCAAAGRVPARRLRPAIAVIAIVLGMQLIYTGGSQLLQQHHSAVARISARASSVAGTWR